MADQVQIFAGGQGISTRQPSFELIPHHAMVRLADRLGWGICRKGDKSWNALSKNQAILQDREFLINRLGHVSQHSLLLIAKLMGDAPWTGDDDAGAIMWGGVFAACSTKALGLLEPGEGDSLRIISRPEEMEKFFAERK